MFDLKGFRKELKLSQKEICEVLGIKQPYASTIEAGKRPLNHEKLKILHEKYGDTVLKYKQLDYVYNPTTKVKIDYSFDPPIVYKDGKEVPENEVHKYLDTSDQADEVKEPGPNYKSKTVMNLLEKIELLEGRLSDKEKLINSLESQIELMQLAMKNQDPKKKEANAG